MTIRRPTRLLDFPYIGLYRYSLRFATYGRDRHFIADDPVATARTEIERTCEEDRFAIFGYCFMPDHVHLVIEGLAETSDLRRFVKVSKQRVAFAFRTKFFVPYIWQEGYYERVLRDDEATEVVVMYVFNNPVRGGLARTPWEYPYSGGIYWNPKIT